MTDEDPIFVANKLGKYQVKVQVYQPFEDAVSGEAGLVAEATAIIGVSGTNIPSGDDCSCRAVGASRPSAWFPIIALLAGMVALFRPPR